MGRRLTADDLTKCFHEFQASDLRIINYVVEVSRCLMKMAQNITQIETAGTRIAKKLSQNLENKSVVKILIGGRDQT